LSYDFTKRKAACRLIVHTIAISNLNSKKLIFVELELELVNN